MANQFVSIPVPAANGSGAAVDMSTFGLQKTISVCGPYDAAVTIEISNQLVPTRWAALMTFNNPDGIVMDVACRWMRATVQRYKSGTPVCDVGGDDSGALFATFVPTAGDGVSPAVDVSLLGPFKTVTVGGPFSGTVQLEVSEDGITNWSQIGFGFPNPGYQTMAFTAHFMRVVRQGVNPLSPGLPLVDIGACSIGGGSVGPPGPTVAAMLPEQWAVNNIQNDVATTDMFSQVSTNFDNIKAIRAGSIVGMRTRLTAAIVAGTITVTVTINGAPTAMQQILAAASTGDATTAAVGSIPYVAGDLIGISYATSLAFAPLTNDIEAFLEVVEPA